MKMSSEEQAYLTRRSAYAWSILQPGDQPASVLSRIYCHNLPDKSPRQGALMANSLLAWLEKYHQSYAAAMRDPTAFAIAAITEELKNLSVDDQCKVLYEAIQVCDVLDHCDSSTVDGVSDLQANLNTVKSYSSDTTNEARNQLLSDLILRIEHLEGSDIVDKCVIGGEIAEEITRADVRSLCGEEMLQALNIMLLYTMVKNGELYCVPSDITMAQVAVCVCTEDQYDDIKRAERSMYISRDRIKQRKTAVNAVFKVMMLTTGAAFAGGFACMMSQGIRLSGLVLPSVVFLSALAVIMPLKFKFDAEMTEDLTDEIPEIPLAFQDAGSYCVTAVTECIPAQCCEVSKENEIDDLTEDEFDYV